jgi:hypothetical protein
MTDYKNWLTDELDDEVTRHPENREAREELDRRWNVPVIRTIAWKGGEIIESVAPNSQYKA